jgi:LysM repeat protein
VIVLLLALGPGANRRAQIIAGSFVVLAVVLFAIPAWGRGTVYLKIGPSWIVPGHHDLWGESRFSVIPVMLLASAVAILLAPTGSSIQRQRVMQRTGIPVFALWFLIVMAVSFPQTTLRGEDPAWISRVDRVVSSECSNRPGAKIVTVPNLVFPAPPLIPKPPADGFYPLVVRCANLGSIPPSIATAPPPRRVVQPPPTVQPPSPQPPATHVYVVQAGDTLWALAARYLGNPVRYQELFALNRGISQVDGYTLVDPNLIYPGMKLLFPADATGIPPTAP